METSASHGAMINLICLLYPGPKMVLIPKISDVNIAYLHVVHRLRPPPLTTGVATTFAKTCKRNFAELTLYHAI